MFTHSDDSCRVINISRRLTIGVFFGEPLCIFANKPASNRLIDALNSVYDNLIVWVMLLTESTQPSFVAVKAGALQKMRMSNYTFKDIDILNHRHHFLSAALIYKKHHIFHVSFRLIDNTIQELENEIRNSEIVTNSWYDSVWDRLKIFRSVGSFIIKLSNHKTYKLVIKTQRDLKLMAVVYSNKIVDIRACFRFIREVYSMFSISLGYELGRTGRSSIFFPLGVNVNSVFNEFEWLNSHFKIDI